MKSEEIIIEIGIVRLNAAQNVQTSVRCFVCNGIHLTHGIARITRGDRHDYVPLCDPCLADHDTDARLIRKYVGAPEMTVTEIAPPGTTRH